ncbi:hypothetical protein N7456_003461 [Penicillium angulare]|uniref:Secreted protein n=1 Tax=Penicillium angulare TaxID=116970 RepID=A0A9W9KI98_9EURO|nr:hypothetical protein N7456_003461 [Penicillium angulare]
MLAIYSKLLAATATAMLFSSALACLQISGTAVYGEKFDGTIATVDSGTKTCSGNLNSGDNDIDCASGYSLNYDFTDNDPSKFPITYCNPQNCYSITVPTTGNEVDGWTFDYETFCA